MNHDDKLMRSIEFMADYAKHYPGTPDLFPLWELLGADDFIALLEKAEGRRIKYQVEYKNFDASVLLSCEIEAQETLIDTQSKDFHALQAQIFEHSKAQSGIERIESITQPAMRALAFSTIRKKFPDEWVLLGDPVMNGLEVIKGCVLFHHKDKKELTIQARSLIGGGAIYQIVFTGKLPGFHRAGMISRLKTA